MSLWTMHKQFQRAFFDNSMVLHIMVLVNFALIIFVFNTVLVEHGTAADIATIERIQWAFQLIPILIVFNMVGKPALSVVGSHVYRWFA